MPRDAIDLGAVVFHNSMDVSDWPITRALTGIELRSGLSNDASCGVRPVIDTTGWPDFRPDGWDGDLRYTLWLFLHYNGRWHGAAVMEFWGDRQWTGAPLLTQFSDWIYAPWGEMAQHRPQSGEDIGFMVTAGDLRLHKDILTVPERSQSVIVKLLPAASYPFADQAPDVPAVPDAPLPPRQPPEVGLDAAMVEAQIRLAVLESKMDALMLQMSEVGNRATLVHVGAHVNAKAVIWGRELTGTGIVTDTGQ